MNMKRMRGRNHRGGGQGGGGQGGSGGPIRHQTGNVPLNRNHVFDSIGPDLRIRGTSQQLFEKYLQLGRDATSSGDRVMAESYFQHAEHYFRILNAMNQAAQQQMQSQPRPREFQPEGGEAVPEQRAEFRNEPQTSELRQQVSVDEPYEDEEPEPIVTTSRAIPITAAPPEG